MKAARHLLDRAVMPDDPPKDAHPPMVLPAPIGADALRALGAATGELVLARARSLTDGSDAAGDLARAVIVASARLCERDVEVGAALLLHAGVFGPTWMIDALRRGCLLVPRFTEALGVAIQTRPKMLDRVNKLARFA